MNAITNNPYRVLGLLAGASNREITRQTSILKRYLSASAELPVDFSFAKLDNFTRTVEGIDTVSTEIDTDGEKMFSSLFWFWKGNEITDEPAFDALQEGDTETAFQIWDKLIAETKEGKRFWKTNSDKNASAFHNIAVLEILRQKGNKNTAIAANILFLESEFYRELVIAATDLQSVSARLRCGEYGGRKKMKSPLFSQSRRWRMTFFVR